MSTLSNRKFFVFLHQNHNVMSTHHPQWSDEYWLMLMQLYLKKPVGVKALYSRGLVSLAMELHIPPQFLWEQMFRLRTIDTPRIEKLWADYGNNPRRLSRGVKLLRQKLGYKDAFFEGVEVNETWERDFRPCDAPNEHLTPVKLIMILDLYFRLTPLTMVAETPEVSELARLMKLKPRQVVDVMEVYQFCDPYLKRNDFMTSPLLVPCQQIWQRFGNGSPRQLAALAAQLKEFFRDAAHRK